ncbi:MAG: DNA-3-methyladenine glycosylase I [Candidatus Azotimanducaceae bacterium]
MGLLEQIDQRCDWCRGDPTYEAYHDEEWGVPLRDDLKLFEFLILEGAQAGLSWITVLRKRENYRQAFWQFNPEKMATFDKREKSKLLNNEGIIRNRLKIDSAVNNAQRFLEIQSKGSFSQFLWQFVDGQPVQNQYQSMSDVPSKTDTSDVMAKTLKKAGFNFVGSTICYALMQATGMVNDHLVTCPRHQSCKDLA